MGENDFIRIDGISVRYDSTSVIEGLDLSIGKGEFVALLGASGCGKTTLLRAIAGFVRPSAGTVSVEGQDVTDLAPDRRGMALVFQSYALWPHMTVAQNIGYGLKLRRLPREEIARRIAELEELLGLGGLGQRKPAALSGGQRQRVALARALAIDPQILLLDEPLSNLDARIRLKVRHDLRVLQQHLGITAIHVTHDREEAMVMADRIVIMNGGRIAQQGSPEHVYNHPASAFVAAFMGAENVLQLSGRVTARKVRIEAGPHNDGAELPLDGRALATGPMEGRFRSEAAELLDEKEALRPAPGSLQFAGRVEAVSYPGGMWRHTVRIGASEVLVDAARAFDAGANVRIRIPRDKLFLFNAPGARAPARHDSSHANRTDRVLEISET